MGGVITRACPFRPQEIADLQMKPDITFEEGDKVNDWNKENCRCVKEGFDAFYCPHWQYSPDELRGIDEMLQMEAEQAKRRGDVDFAKSRDDLRASLLLSHAP